MELEGTVRGERFFVDGHVDLPHYMMSRGLSASLDRIKEGPFTLEKARQAGVRLFCTAVYCEDRFNGKPAWAHFQSIFHFTLERFNPVIVVRSRKDLTRSLEACRASGTFFLLENADALAGRAGHVQELKEQGIRIIGLTHAGENRLAQGNGVSYPEGLTNEGKGLIAVLKEEGLFLDVAHLHSKCFRQVLDYNGGPMVSSHTGIREKCDIPRNLALDQVREILDTGGMIGITFNPEMLSEDGRAGVDDFFAHLDTVVQRFGATGVGVGSDFCGFRYPAEGLEDITQIDSIVQVMEKHGYPEEAIRRICGLNWLHLYEGLFR